MISDVSQLSPTTTWRETIWAWTPEDALIDHTRPSRLCGAMLLPFAHGRPDWKSFEHLLNWQRTAAKFYGVDFVPVLNADTGYIFQLTPELYAEVLQRFRSLFPGDLFITGVTADRATSTGSVVDRYRRLLDLAQSHDHCEIMIMTSPVLENLGEERRRDAYYELAAELVRPALVHALEPAFVPWARPFSPWLLKELAAHPKFVGGKISTLDEPHFLYWTAMARAGGWKFQPHSGDDFGIASAIKMGMPLLIGAAAGAGPLICAAKQMWRFDSSGGKKMPSGGSGFDTRVYKLFEAIQSLCDEIFRLDDRLSASAYKHSLAHLLHGMGLVESPEAHPDCPDLRPSGESERMEAARRRVGKMVDQLGLQFWPGASNLNRTISGDS